MTNLELQQRLKEKKQGSPLKWQFSDFVPTYTEKQLLSFDTLNYPGVRRYENNGIYEIDTTYQREGAGAMRFTMTRTDHELAEVLWDGGRSFEFSVKDRHHTTLKVWLFVDDADNFVSDHDAGYGRQAAQATFFFRVFDAQGRVYCWNHTLTGNGWHEVELTFNTHNGISPDFDYDHIVGFGLLTAAGAGTVIELDDLRVVYYTTDHIPESFPSPIRLITDGEYNALDGVIVQEWYGCCYDKEDKVFGKSSLRCEGDTSVNDFRTIIGTLDIPMSYQNDVLVFWMKIEDLATVSSLFIELNQVQDTHEYEYTAITKEKLFAYGLSKTSGEWSEIRIPLTDFKKNFRPDLFGESEDITLCNARFCISGIKGTSYVVHYDRIYLTTKDALNA